MTRVTTAIDLDAPGRQFGYLDVPSSRDDSAWGDIRCPIFVLANGEGPTVLLVGGNHGDEYEGPIALSNLARALSLSEIAGRVVILPMLNAAAVQAGTRVSPVDGVNMNRAFPGHIQGTPSQALAHYVTQYILPKCDIVVDIHSGGKTMMIAPFACIHDLGDPARMERSRRALDAFAAPISLILTELDAAGMLDTTVEEMGCTFISTELGGGGTATPDTIRLAERGARNILAHAGILAEPVAGQAGPLHETAAPGSFLKSNHHGIFEICVDLGQPVIAGQLLARVHSLTEPDREPIPYHAGRDGVLLGRHHPGLIRQGDFLAMIGAPVA